MFISMTDANGSYSISLERDFDTLEEIIELLVKPILLAASFSEAQLDQYFVKEDEFQIVFEGWDDDEDEEDDEPMEKVVCKKVAPAAKQATAKMAG